MFTFYAAKDFKTVHEQTPWVGFPEELDLFLWENRDKLSEQAKLLYDLDPYGLEILKGDQITQMIQVCEELLREQELLADLGAPPELSSFLRNLLDLCHLSRGENVNLIASGD